MGISVLWKDPEINPFNKKARSIPVLNPINKYGRVFTFSWMGFMIAFWSWYAFPPLMSKTIKADLHLSQNQISNSNFVALTATLVVRFVAGPLCDRFGPRYVFIGCLLCGALPTALAGTVTSASGLITIRFFIGILGGTFVPCQVWSMGFFDKNVVGTSNALIGGWGNAGGGITYFAMPAIFDSLVKHQGLTPHVAWRVAFIVPFILITSTALGMLFLCPDTPVGKWQDRHVALAETVQHEVERRASLGVSVDTKNISAATGGIVTTEKTSQSSDTDSERKEAIADVEAADSHDVATGQVYQAEAVVKPSIKEIMKVVTCPQTLVLAACYFNSFGAELAINSVLGAYYLKNFPKLGQTGSGRWAAMFGLVNVVFRPAGGIVADILYNKTKGSLWAKKLWIHFVGIMAGVFCFAIGLVDPHNLATMIGLVVGLAFFTDAGNGANYALVPHTLPYANGIVSGTVGATGNFGGIIFAIIFRYTALNYHKTIWIIGCFFIAMNLAVSWIKPIPKGQVGGR